jgi:ABC-type nitrate/sulfonate/bicarbonate transport system permease component
MVLSRMERYAIWGVSILSVLVIWEYLSSSGTVSPLVLPSPLSIAASFQRMISSGEMFIDIWTSTARIFIGFTVAFVIALPLGLIAGSNQIIRNLLKPWVQLTQPIPGIAWVPFAFLLFGLSNNAAVFVIAIACFFPLFIGTMSAVQRFDRDLINVAKTLGANDLQVFMMVILPGISPDIVTGSRVATGFAWRTVVAAEIIGLKEGVGSLLIEAKNTAQTDVVIVSMITLGVLMILFEKVIFEGMEKRIARWKGAERES